MKSCEYISFEVYYIDSISTKKLTGRCKNDVFIIEINLASILHGVVIFFIIFYAKCCTFVVCHVRKEKCTAINNKDLA